MAAQGSDTDKIEFEVLKLCSRNQSYRLKRVEINWEKNRNYLFQGSEQKCILGKFSIPDLILEES